MAAVEFDDARGGALEEDAVVRDEQNGGRAVHEKRLEPCHRLDVQVVGRLVEQEQVGLTDQRARQQHAAPPSARERRGADVGLQAQPRQHGRDTMVALPFVLAEVRQAT